MRALPAGNLTQMVGDYITEKTGAKLVPGMFQAFMVVNDNNDFVAGVTISNYRETDCEISCAGETPMAWRPHVCKAIFTYIFEQLGCIRCTSITTKRNRPTRRFLEGFGFRLEGTMRLGYDGVKDALIYGLLRSECGYLADESGAVNGKEKRPGSAPRARSSGDGGSAIDYEQRDGGSASEPEPDQPVYAAG